MTTLDPKALEAARAAFDKFVEGWGAHSAIHNAITAYLDALASIPEQGGDDFTERLREAAYRDTAKSITVSAADLRAHLEATQRYVLAKLAPSHPAAVAVTDEMVERAAEQVWDGFAGRMGGE
jgi:hypothetical protein